MKKLLILWVGLLIAFFGCSSGKVKQETKPDTKVVPKLTGCAKYLHPSNTYKGGCAEGNCISSWGIFVYNNGDCYEGYNQSNKRHGRGTMHYKNWGEKYVGDWLNDNRVGRGVLTFNNGDTYDGEFKLNVPWGTGVYRYADGSTENGEFFDYLFTGATKLPGLKDEDKKEMGKVTDINESAFEVTVTGSNLKIGDKLFVEIKGLMAAMEVTFPMMTISRCKMIGGTRMLIREVYKGMPVYKLIPGINKGNNTFLFPNGNRFVGDYKGNQMHGKGEFYWTNGNVYKGDFKNGMRHGKGDLIYYNGSKYSGDWKSGFMDGNGEYTWSNGNKHIGQFKKGFREGKATFLWAKGDKYVGTFKKDLMDGFGEYTSVKGESYKGQYKDDMKDGKGTYKWANGDQYVGEWKQNKQEGKGTYTWKDGGKYVGEWKNHKMHGKGVEYDPKGKVIHKGLWDNGKFIGQGV
jgi:hypothetical protein